MDRRWKAVIILVPIICGLIIGGWIFVTINTPQSTGTIHGWMFVRYVRGITDYGINDFIDNGDGTITDNATGLMWSQADSGEGFNWEGALAWVHQKNDENFLGYNDWRLPNAKELQSIVDYTRSPDTTNSAAIDPIFNVTSIIDEGGETNYPFYWTSTTHVESGSGDYAVYIAFGEALGYMQSSTGEYTLMDVHGAGAQRSDPKNGDPSDYPYGHGPQGDVIRIYNYVRCVRDAPEGPTNYVIVDTGQTSCYDNNNEISPPSSGAAFYGQDAQFNGVQPSYQDNGDGTVTDLNTGLMWQQTPGDRVTYDEAVDGAATFELAGYDDWRLPTIKELYSLIKFDGNTGMNSADSIPYLDTAYFDFEYGDTSAAWRFIDAQYWSSTEYVSTTMSGNRTVFGVNFADGRIKGYPRDPFTDVSSMTQFVVMYSAIQMAIQNVNRVSIFP
ncbi:MAG: DUF1566 domain-containing protein [Promethearchaeota archaeon]